jgi:PAS domain-containing protein
LSTIRDIERKRAGQLDLTAIVQASDDAIIGKTLDGAIVSWNRGAEKIYGYKSEEIVGTSLADGLVFGTRTGGTVSTRNFEDDMVRLAQQVGIVGMRFSPHSLRLPLRPHIPREWRRPVHALPHPRSCQCPNNRDLPQVHQSRNNRQYMTP